jgi:outer membrane protein TolC
MHSLFISLPVAIVVLQVAAQSTSAALRLKQAIAAFSGDKARRVLAVRRLAAVALCSLAVGACARLSPDGGMDAVAGIAGDALNKDVVAIRTPEEASAARARVARLLRRPLTADSAVQTALLNNRGLQAAYNELGVAETAMVEASLPPSPTFSLEHISGPLETEIERHVIADILALATLPARSENAAKRFHAAQLRAAQKTLQLAYDTRRAFYRAVAARELVGLLEQAVSASQSAAELAKRLGESGAMNKLDQARQQTFHAETVANLERARREGTAERERLTRVLGLDDGLNFKIPASLPALPGRPRTLRAAETEALARRLDLQVARIELDALAKSYGLTRATRFVNVFNVAAASKTTIDKPTGEHIQELGPDVELQIPLFDFGEVRVRAAEETYMQAVNRLAEMAVNARSQAREAYQAYRSSYRIAAQYRNEVLPLRQTIADETTLRYNAMMIDVFGLLTEARQRVASQTNSVEAHRDFLLAAVDLDAATLGGGASDATGEAMSVSTMPGDAK